MRRNVTNQGIERNNYYKVIIDLVMTANAFKVYSLITNKKGYGM